jgi:selenide,water dikinase
LGPATLAQVLRALPKNNDPRLLVGLETMDDAAVIRLDDKAALVQTVDFFTPIVDDPYEFGRIAAANALSDIYAMGAEPLTAMNIISFPTCLGTDVLTKILLGGQAKVTEAGAILVGGHSVEDKEPKYGLAVTGIVDPAQIITNAGAKPGDSLILTKPLGTGIMATAVKGDLATPSETGQMIAVMAELNKTAAAVMRAAGAGACTDITGFGLLGHAHELAAASGVALRLQAGQIPILAAAKTYAAMGLVPAGAYANREHLAGIVNFAVTVDGAMQDVLFDPQTSGGLLFALPATAAAAALAMLRERGLTAAIIGAVTAGEPGTINVE